MAKPAREPAEELRSERDRFVAFSFAAADLLVEVGQDRLIRFASGAARSMTGREPGRLIGTSFETLFAEEDRRFVTILLDRLGMGSRLDPVIVHLLTPGGRRTAAVFGGCRVPGQGDALFLTFSTPRQVPVRRGPGGARDRATGLLERESFERAASEVMRQQAATGKGTKLTLLHLVGVEDLRVRAGVEATEAFLREVGAFLRAVSVNGDSAGQLADDRLGVIHSTSIDSGSVTTQVADLARHADPTGQGLAIDRQTVDLALETMTEQDAARALAYTIGKFVDPATGSLAVESLQDAFRTLLRETVTRIGALRGTVSENRFDVAFQPIVDLATRAVQHHELLARLDGGKSPYALVTFAEGVGMIEEFDLAICQRAIEFLLDKSSGGTAIAVNLSGRSMESALFAEALFALLKPYREIGPRLLFELTESTQISALEQVNGVIQALRARGHRFALDDFGAGASSFPYLHALTVDFVKIDGAYVRRVLSSRRDAAILRSMVTLCHELGVKTIAEMVETEEQVGELRALGVDFGQGYLFGRPAPQPIAIERPGLRNIARPMVRPGTGQSWS